MKTKRKYTREEGGRTKRFYHSRLVNMKSEVLVDSMGLHFNPQDYPKIYLYSYYFTTEYSFHYSSYKGRHNYKVFPSEHGKEGKKDEKMLTCCCLITAPIRKFIRNPFNSGRIQMFSYKINVLSSSVAAHHPQWGLNQPSNTVIM